LKAVLIGWIKAGPPKKPLLFQSCKQAICELGEVYTRDVGWRPLQLIKRSQHDTIPGVVQTVLII